MADFILKISPNIAVGSYASSRIGHLAGDWGNRYMLFADPVLADFGVIEKIGTSLKERNIDYFVFDEIPEAPNTALIERTLKLARDARVQGVITVGGTRISSAGRAAAALCNEKRGIYDFTDGTPLSAPPLPCICVPTTVSNAFIFSDMIPITDSRTGQLTILKVLPSLCSLAVFDPNLAITLTENQFITMMLHTVCISIEAYLSQKANFFSDTVIEKSFDLLSCALSAESAVPVSAVPKQQFAMEGGCMAALGAGCSSGGAVNFLAQAINARHNLPPALIAAVLLPHLIEDAAAYKAERLVKIARLLKAAQDTQSTESTVSALAEMFRNKIAEFKLPARLKDLSLSMEQLALCVGDLGKIGSIQNFHRSMTEDDLFELIKRAF